MPKPKGHRKGCTCPVCRKVKRKGKRKGARKR